MCRKALGPLFLSLLVSVSIQASSVQRFQPLNDTLAKYRIGKIPVASDYPDVPAVALLSYQEYRQLGAKHERRFHKIVKILTAAGKEYTTIRIPCYSTCHVEARTIKPSGKILNLPGRDLFRSEQMTEYSSPFFLARFAMPGVEPGDIIEYTATVEYPVPFLIEEYRFAEPYPIVKGILVLMHPEEDSYSYVRQSPAGTSPIEVTQDTVVDPPARWVRTTFVVKQVRASINEPYARGANQGQPGLRILIERKSGREFDVFKDWWKYGSFIAEQAKISALFNAEIRNFLQKATGDSTDSIGIVKNVYRAAEERIQITSESLLLSGFLFEDPEEVFEDKKGAPHDFALFLAACFKSLKWGADLILVNSYDQAEVSKESVFPPLLDLVFLNVKTPRGEVLLDCNQNGLPPGGISSKAMNRFALGIPILFDVHVRAQENAYTTRMPYREGNKSHLQLDAVPSHDGWMIEFQWTLGGEFQTDFVKTMRQKSDSEFRRKIQTFLRSRLAAAEWNEIQTQLLPAALGIKGKAIVPRRRVSAEMELLQNEIWNSGFELRQYLFENRTNELLLPVTGEISSSLRIHFPEGMIPTVPASTEIECSPVHYTLSFRKARQELQVDEKILIQDLAVKPAVFPKFIPFLDHYYKRHFWSILFSSKLAAASSK